MSGHLPGEGTADLGVMTVVGGRVVAGEAPAVVVVLVLELVERVVLTVTVTVAVLVAVAAAAHVGSVGVVGSLQWLPLTENLGVCA